MSVLWIRLTSGQNLSATLPGGIHQPQRYFQILQPTLQQLLDPVPLP